MLRLEGLEGNGAKLFLVLLKWGVPLPFFPVLFFLLFFGSQESQYTSDTHEAHPTRTSKETGFIGKGFFTLRHMDIAIFFSQEDNDEQLKQIEAHFANY